MKVLNVELQKSINGILFDSERTYVRKIVDMPYVEFNKSKYSKTTTDDYKLFHIFYDENNRFNAIEIFSGIDVMVSNKNIMLLNLNELKELFDDLINDGNGNYTSKNHSVAFCTNGEKVESILFGRKGYFV